MKSRARTIALRIGLLLLPCALLNAPVARAELSAEELAKLAQNPVGNLISIPFGTALGIYAIWALMKDETIRLFRPEAQAQAGAQRV